jgi:heme A synthase
VRVDRLALVTAAATFCLLLAGASVTSTGSGLAVPDWPLSYGTLFPPMTGGILFEHGHRMIAGAVGLLIFVLAWALHRSREAPVARRLGLAAALLVVVQALLGGVTVLLMLPALVSTAHAVLAMVVFGLVLSVAVVTSRSWRETPLQPAPSRARGLALLAVALVAVQILLGAVVRHTGAGLACPDFPLCGGRLWPELSDPSIAVHFAHRLGALAVGVGVLTLGLAARRAAPRVAAGAWVAVGLVAVQIGLGGAAVLSGLAPAVTVAHHAAGALLLAATLWCALWGRRGAAAATVPSPAGAEALA